MSGTTPSVAPIVVIAADGTGDSVCAVEHLRQIVPNASRWEIVAAIPPPPDPETGATGFAAPIVTPEQAGRAARADLVAGDADVAATARALGPVPAGATVAHGDLAEAVVERARELAAHLVVVAATSSSRLDGLLSASPADRILASAPCPVLVLPVPQR